MFLRHGEGRFVHIVEQNEGGPSLSDLQAFRAFQKDAGERIQGGRQPMKSRLWAPTALDSIWPKTGLEDDINHP